MPLASVMADEPKPTPEDGAPVSKDAIDPELVRLRGPRPKVGIVTAAGLVILALVFLIKLSPDRRFSGSTDKPEQVAVADVLAGRVAVDRYIALDADPLMSHAIRTTVAKGSYGLRVAPVRGTGERLWIVMSGDGWEEPRLDGYQGRLRRLGDLPFAPSVREFARRQPRPVFAGPDAVRAGLATGKVTTVTGDVVSLADADRVAYDVIDPSAAVLVCSLDDRFPTQDAWAKALAAAGLEVKPTPATISEEARFELAMPDAVAAARGKLEAAQLWAARVDPATRHEETTWGALRAAPPPALAQADLVGLYVARAIPDDAYALITGEQPAEYWYVMPVTIALAAMGLLFAWALVRAIRRDLWPARA